MTPDHWKTIKELDPSPRYYWETAQHITPPNPTGRTTSQGRGALRRQNKIRPKAKRLAHERAILLAGTPTPQKLDRWMRWSKRRGRNTSRLTDHHPV